MAGKLRWLGLGIALLAAALFILLQTPRGALLTANALCAWLMPNRVTLGGVRGNWIRTLHLREVAFFNQDGSLLFSADTLRVRHQLFSLLGGSYRAADITVVNPLFILPASDDSTQNEPESSDMFPIRLDKATVKNGVVELPDSTILSAVNLRGSMQLDSSFALRLEEATAEVALFGVIAPLSVVTSGWITGAGIELDTLGIAGAVSRVSGGGHLAWSGNHYDSDFSVGGGSGGSTGNHARFRYRGHCTSPNPPCRKRRTTTIDGVRKCARGKRRSGHTWHA